VGLTSDCRGSVPAPLAGSPPVGSAGSSAAAACPWLPGQRPETLRALPRAATRQPLCDPAATRRSRTALGGLVATDEFGLARKRTPSVKQLSALPPLILLAHRSVHQRDKQIDKSPAQSEYGGRGRS
jgi:hypothetical protein